METPNKPRKTTVRLTYQETVKLEQMIRSGLSNKQLRLVMPRISDNNIYNLRAKIGIREYSKWKNVPVTPQPVAVSQPAAVPETQPVVQDSTVSYTINGVTIQVSKAPKSINIKDNSFTLEF